MRRFYRDLHVVQNNLNNLKKSGYGDNWYDWNEPQMRDDFIDEMQVDGTELSLQMRKDCFIEFLTLLRAVQVL